jgi:hypothetical protein
MSLTDNELLEIKEQLRIGYCNPQWKQRVEQLVSEVERLQSLLDMITRLSGDDPEEANHDPGSDTIIL